MFNIHNAPARDWLERKRGDLIRPGRRPGHLPLKGKAFGEEARINLDEGGRGSDG